MQEQIEETVRKLLDSNMQENIFLAINILTEKQELLPLFKEKYFLHKYITTDMSQEEFERWADIVFKK